MESNWILVEDEMPPAGQRVLITHGKQETWEAYWSGKEWARDVGGIRIRDLEALSGPVLGWMPMPDGRLRKG